MEQIQSEPDKEKKLKLFNQYTDMKERQEEEIAQSNGLMTELQQYKGLSMVSLLEIQKIRGKIKPQKEIKFKLPDELADRMKEEFEKAKKIAEAKAKVEMEQ